MDIETTIKQHFDNNNIQLTQAQLKDFVTYYDLIIETYDISESGDLKWSAIKYKDTKYLVIYGENVRTRFSKNLAQVLLNGISFDKTRKEYSFKYDKKYNIPIYIMVDNAIRKDKIDYRKFIIRDKLRKECFINLLKFDFRTARFITTKIKETKLEIKYLR